MKNWIIHVGFCLLSCFAFAQERGVEKKEKSIVLDSLYREDQFYMGFTVNLLLNKPEGISQSGFSGGLHLGFIRDMPINKRRNLAIGAGIGYSFNSYNQNLGISNEDEDTEGTLFLDLSDVDYERNRFTTHLVEAPIEFRWRTSVPETHKFYRIYAGLKMGYLFSFISNYINDSGIQIKERDVTGLNRVRTGLTFTFGWNTFNFHFYYSLNPLFGEDAVLEQETVGLNVIKLGLMFYIL